jgi:hypothetical protein
MVRASTGGMKTVSFGGAAVSIWLGLASCGAFAQTATVIEAVNSVDHGSRTSGDSSPAHPGTSIRDGEDVWTGVKSLAELELSSTSITRLGANTTFNYSVASNTVDLQAGTLLFCKPKKAQQLQIKTAAVTAGIVGTTGFVSVQGEGGRKTYIIGLIEGHAIAFADGHPFPLGPGDALEFKPGTKPFSFAYDVPRFVRSTPLIKRFHSTLPNQPYVDAELVRYADDVSRGFIMAPSKAIDYTGDIPLLSTSAYDSAQNSQAGRSKPSVAPPPPTQSYSPGNYNNSSYH